MTRPLIDSPQVVFEDVLEVIKTDALGQARDLQRRIGPSGLGVECPIWLAHMLAETIEPNRGKVKWQAWVGTAMHTRFEGIFRRDNLTVPTGPGRWLVEQFVTVGMINGVPITGHSDLFDRYTGTVIDHKTCSKSQLVKVEREIRLRKSPGQQKRVQAHTYGLGMLMQGEEVNQVMNIFYPRDGEFAETIYWAEDFDPSIALDTLAKCDAIVRTGIAEPSIGVYGVIAKHLSENPNYECPDYFCPWCVKKRREPSYDGPTPTKADPFGLG